MTIIINNNNYHHYYNYYDLLSHLGLGIRHSFFCNTNKGITECAENIKMPIFIRHEICQKFYTARFSG